MPQDKNWWKSKSIWTSLALVVSAIAISLGIELTPEITMTLLMALLGIFGINLRYAIGSNKSI